MEVQWLRYLNEMRQSAGMAIFFGTMAILPVFIGICSSTNDDQDWSGNKNTFPPIAMLLANLMQAIYGITNIAVGMGWLLLDKGDKTYSFINMVLTYLSWFPYLVMIAALSFMADKFSETGMQPFIPMDYNPTNKQVNSVAALEVLGFVAYAANLVGALTFFATKLFRMHTDTGLTVYNRQYYNSRQIYYTVLTLLAGVTQLALGSYVQDEFGEGRLEAPIGEGPYLVSYSEISIAMGCLILVHGMVLLSRSFGSHEMRKKSASLFQAWTFFVFLAAGSIQILAQVAVAPGTSSGKAIGVFDVLALAVMPTYLDIKACSTHETIADDYYSTNPSYEKVAV